MKRVILSALATVIAVTALSAQTPAGWKMRVDKSTSASDPDGSGTIKFVTMGTGMHATNPQAATYFNPANTACSGGDAHGKTSHLSATDIDALVAYLETL